jgi:hypothetical protein
VEDGAVRFRPVLLRRSEFRAAGAAYDACGLGGTLRRLEVPRGALAFSFCQVPVLYTLSRDGAWIRVTAGDGASSTRPGDRLDAATSRALFERRGGIARIEVGVPEESLCRV